ncbi:helix-turn-helix domain-containing protein [Streptococcus pluranimalium]|uniref:Transcriptional regulator n=1 Tax=Streptococcus pluranimalium TaxID=82348 RepID=A0A2L0D6L2_9STRE|nr:XRE family transcriptional regulator [Streptococcus pluranimalium]AUW97211.1 transcriptional regulator [Streptococcus pluranimalium]
MVQEFNGDRLRESRYFRQYSISQLADNIGVSKQMISKYEKNLSKPSSEVLQKIIFELGFPLSYYQTKDKFLTSDFGTFYRSKLTSSQAEKKSSEMLKKALALLANFFEDYVDFPKLAEFESRENASPEEVASQIRENWGLGDKPIFSVLRLLETHGFHIAIINSRSEKVDAFGSFVELKTGANSERYYCILIDQDNNNFFRQQFSLAHELGHWALHAQIVHPQELSNTEYRKMEQEANRFASSFLLPASAFSKDIKGHEEDLGHYLKLKSKWNVSIASMVYRAKDLNLLTSEQYTRLQKRMSARGWRREEPEDASVPVPRPILAKQAYKLLTDAGLFEKQSIVQRFNLKYGYPLPIEILSELMDIPRERLFQDRNNIVQLKGGTL